MKPDARHIHAANGTLNLVVAWLTDAPAKQRDWTNGAMGEWAPSIEKVEDRRAVTPADIRALVKEGRFEEAEAHLVDEIEHNPTSARPLVLLGRLLMRRRRLPDALNAFLRAMEVDPLSLDASIGAGVVALRGRDAATAERYFKNAIKLDADSARAHVGLARALLAKGDLKQARVAADHAIELDPMLTIARGASAQIRLEAGDVGEAISDLEALVALDPSNRNAIRKLVDVLRREGGTSKALEFLEELADDNPGDRQAGRRAERFAQRIGQPERALESLRQRMTAETVSLADRAQFVSALIGSGATDEAREELGKFPEGSRPQMVRVLLEGHLAMKLGDLAKAAKSYKLLLPGEVVAEDADVETIKRLRKRAVRAVRERARQK